MGADTAATFLAEAGSPAQARRYAVDQVERHGLGHLANDVALCASELAANAVLHTRGPYTLTVRQVGLGVRLDVIDGRPEHLPLVVPQVGTVVDLTERSTTGRGLQIVAALADRWGVSTTNGAKAVWVELSGETHDGPSAPTVVIGHEERPSLGTQLCFEGLPVRAAVASGIQTDEAAREVQLAELAHPSTQPLDDTGPARLLELLDRTAALRLAGRYAALRAAAEGRERFDLEVVVTRDALAATGELAEALRTGGGSAPAPGADVEAFRRWLADETVHQLRGKDPRTCPLPT